MKTIADNFFHCVVELDPASEHFADFEDGYIKGNTYTIERDGKTFAGCRISRINRFRDIVAVIEFEGGEPMPTQAELISTPSGNGLYKDMYARFQTLCDEVQHPKLRRVKKAYKKA